MWRRRLRPEPGGTKAFVYAVLVHVTLLLLLGLSLRFSLRSPEPPKVVQATVVDESAKKPPAEPPDTARLEEQRRREAEAERTRQEQLKREQEAERRRAEEAKRQKVAEEAQRQKAAETERRQKEEAKRKKELAQQQKAEEAARQKAAAQEKQRAAEQRRKEAESALQAEVAAEEQRRAEARALSEVERYKGLIRQKVSRFWNRPAGTAKGLQCTVRVRLGPGGAVLSASVVRSSGDNAFDRSVENAVYKAEPLPVPQDAKVFEYFRDVEFVFIPEN